MLAVGERVAEMRREREIVDRQNLAAEIGNGVGKIVGNALSQMQNNLARAMR